MLGYEYDVTVISDIFPGGADPSTADLTPKAIKSGMRFWFRAMMGSVVGDDLPRLKELERRIFGLAGEGLESSLGSPFRLRIQPIGRNGLPKPAAYSLRDHQDDPGYVYLAFPFRRGNGAPGRTQCIPAGSRFRIRIDILRHEHGDMLGILTDCLWLLSYFGGVGARTRRTFGSLAVDDRYFSLQDTTTVETIGEFLTRRVTKIQASFASLAQVADEDRREADRYTSFSRWEGRVVVRSDWTDVLRVQSDLGKLLRLHRNDILGDLDEFDDADEADFAEETVEFMQVVQPIMDDEAPHGTLGNDALGLPIEYYRLQTRTRATAGWGPRNKGRRASPLVLRPLRLSPDRFAALVAFFPAEFLPPKHGGTAEELCVSVGGGARRRVAVRGDIDGHRDDLFGNIDYLFEGSSYPVAFQG